MSTGIAQVAQAWPTTPRESTASQHGPNPSPARPDDPGFIGRTAELEAVLRGLHSSGGPHFWLVVAPPGLGKSSFLDLLRRQLQVTSGWEVRTANAGDIASRPAAEPAPLLGQFFGQDLNDLAELDIPGRVAETVLADGRQFVCLLDSAELLSRDAITRIRQNFSEIYKLTGSRSGNGVGRVALVVASRLDAGWLGIAPAPRFRLLPLTALRKDDIGDALRELAARTHKSLTKGELDQATAWLGALSAGVPELLAPCLRWIDRHHWRQLGVSGDDGLFHALGYPFVHRRLLSSASLLPTGQSAYPAERRQAVEYALRLLVPYRIFTQSHLRQHLAAGSRLATELESARWSFEDLWNAIAGSALLDRPQDEVWWMVQPAIRQLLFRTFYNTTKLRAEAQVRALEFDRIWSEGQAGFNQVAGLAECLWHEASALHGARSGGREVSLTESARALANTLRRDEPFTVDDLRQLLADRLRNDVDLSALLNHSAGALERIIDIVTPG